MEQLVRECTYVIYYGPEGTTEYRFHAFREDSGTGVRWYQICEGCDPIQTDHPISGENGAEYVLRDPYKREVVENDGYRYVEKRWYKLPDIGCDVVVRYEEILRFNVRWSMIVEEFLPCGNGG